jgi:Immunoglobulin I-set domain
MAPRFIEKLSPQHTQEGYTIQFECRVEGFPRPQIIWFRETAAIKPSQDFQMFYDEDNTATLIIREVFPEDAGTFTCVAKNACGFASSTTQLVVEAIVSDTGSDTVLSRKSISRESSLADILEGIPPIFSRKPKAQCVDENTNVILECRLVAVPEPDIKWYYNGEEISTKDNVNIVTESDMHMYCSVVHIKKVKKSQEGVYEVVATNREGESRLPIKLKVRTGQKEAPEILEPLKNMIIREGDSVVLTTQIVGLPKPKVTWFKNGKEITGNSKTDKDTYMLQIITPTLDDTGEYTAKAENPMGSVETTATLNVEESESGNPEAPMFVERFEEQNVPQNGTIRLPARVIGNPVPEVFWLHNNKALKPNDRIRSSYDGENIELLIFSADSEIDSGNYKCVASNPIGKTSHGAKVIVDVDKVSFTRKLKKTATIVESTTYVLECETSHTVSTKWFHNDVELSGMDHRVVVQDGRVHKLVIKKASVRDTGVYTCSVKDQRTQASLTVREAKPEFIKKVQDYEAKERESAILEVEITSEIADVTWYKDGEEILPEPERVEIVKSGRQRKLLIRNISVHDEGEYTCALAEQECTAEVTVIELPPEILTKMQDQTIAKGETASFDIELTKGDALVRWFKNNTEIVISERIQLKIDGKKQRLIINDAVSDDAAEYSCTVGEQISKAKLTVEQPMVDFIKRLPDITLTTKDSDAEFVVELSKNVPVKWYKDKEEIVPSSKYTIVVDKNVRKLIVHKSHPDDAHTYTCVACNVKTSSKLKVETIKMAPTISLDDKNRQYKVRENEDVTFTVKFNAAPQPEAEWTVSKKVVTKSPRHTPTVDEKSACLTIRKVTDEDAGEYTIRLKNDGGDAEATLNLIIMSKFIEE